VPISRSARQILNEIDPEGEGFWPIEVSLWTSPCPPRDKCGTNPGLSP
jgi:hypothetical protein